jgi:hypothetical protein
MIISIRQTGGYAGIEQPIGSIDTATLPPRAAQRVRARLDELAAAAADAQPGGADEYRFEVEVAEDGGRRQTFSLTDDSGTGELPLVLQEILRPA